MTPYWKEFVPLTHGTNCPSLLVLLSVTAARNVASHAQTTTTLHSPLSCTEANATRQITRWCFRFNEIARSKLARKLLANTSQRQSVLFRLRVGTYIRECETLLTSCGRAGSRGSLLVCVCRPETAEFSSVQLKGEQSTVGNYNMFESSKSLAYCFDKAKPISRCIIFTK